MWVVNVLVDDLHIYPQSVTKLFRQNTYLDVIPPLDPQYNVDNCHHNLLKQHNGFYCKGYLLKSNIVGRGGAEGLFKSEVYIEKPIVGTFL